MEGLSRGAVRGALAPCASETVASSICRVLFLGERKQTSVAIRVAKANAGLQMSTEQGTKQVEGREKRE